MGSPINVFLGIRFEFYIVQLINVELLPGASTVNDYFHFPLTINTRCPGLTGTDRAMLIQRKH